jgi:hypothetical protein
MTARCLSIPQLRSPLMFSLLNYNSCSKSLALSLYRRHNIISTLKKHFYVLELDSRDKEDEEEDNVLNHLFLTVKSK